MCRLVAAVGRDLPVDRLVAAAQRMARGSSAGHERSELVHDAGWGVAWYRPGAEWSHFKSEHAINSDRKIGDVIDLVQSTAPSACLIHVRNASFNGLLGRPYVHPQFYSLDRRPRWGLMHNGSMPGLRELLGSARGLFDSADYVRLAARVLEAGDPQTGPTRLLDAIDSLGGGGWTAANALIFNRDRLIVVNHFPSESPYPRFYTMHAAGTFNARFFASEACLEIAPVWRPIGRRVAVEVALSHFKEFRHESRF